MRTKLALATILLGCAAIGTAQQDSVDVLPLAINNSWGYRFYNYHYFGAGSNYAERDTGFAACYIVSSVVSSDSIRWQITRRRNFTRQRISHGIPQPPFQVQDTVPFEIVEFALGCHQIYVPTAGWWSYETTVFPFWRLPDYIPNPDTTRFYRYCSVDSGGFLRVNTYLGAIESITRNLVFQRDVGVIQSMGTCSRVNAEYWSWRYYLEQFPVHVREVEPVSIPRTHFLSQNYPNPFNPRTSISFGVSHSTNVLLKVFDILGQEVATLTTSTYDPGTYSVNWDATNKPSGIYFYRMETEDFVTVRRMLLIK